LDHLLAVCGSDEWGRNFDVYRVDPGVNTSTNISNRDVSIDVGVPPILNLNTTIPLILKDHPLGAIVGLEHSPRHTVSVEGLIALYGAKRVGDPIRSLRRRLGGPGNRFISW
jgi:hypothetical protein